MTTCKASGTKMKLDEYQIVEFVNEKEGNKISVDCVPCKWVTYDPIRATCVCKFMPPPYTKKSTTELKASIIAQHDAPINWICYPVYLRSQAKTYTEGQQKVSALLNSNQDYVYSTDNEEHAKAKSATITKIFQETSKTIRKKDVNEIMYNSNLEEPLTPERSSTSASDVSDEDSSSTDNECQVQTLSSKKKCTTSGTKKQYPTEEDDRSSIKSKTTIAFSKNTESQSNTSSSSHSRMTDQGTTAKELSFRTGSSAERNMQQQNRQVHKKVNFEDMEPRYLENFSNETLLIHSSVKSLAAVVSEQTEQIRQLRNCIDQTLKIRVSGITVEEFSVKHEIKFKLSSLEELKDFCHKLSDKQCHLDFTAALKYFVEDDMYKTILAITKRLLEREVAMQCTAVRESKQKFNMKDTNFCKTLFELVCKNCTFDNGKPVTEKAFNRALGSIFNNAKDWDGQQNVRRLVSNARQTKDKHGNRGEPCGEQ